MKYLVLFTHQTWPMHYFQAGIIARALMNEGHEIFWLNCAKTMPGCHVHWILPNVPSEKICNTCVERTSWLHEMGIKPSSLGNYLTSQDYDDAREVEKQKDLIELSSLMDGDTPIGALALSSPASASRTLSIHDPDPALEKSLPTAVASALLVNRALKEFFQRHSVDGIIFHLGRLIPDRIAQFYASGLGIPWYSFETGSIPNYLRIIKNSTIYSRPFYREHWSEFKDYHLSASESQKISAYLALRRSNPKKSGLYVYSPEQTGRDELLDQLNVPRDAKLISLFTSSQDEVATLNTTTDPDWAPVYESQLQAIGESIGWAKANPGWYLIIRVHPNESSSSNHLGIAGRKSMDSFMSFINEQDLPRNVRIVMPQDKVSSYTLMEVSRAGIAWLSTVGIEMTTMGRPVVVLDNPAYRTAGFTWNVNKPGDLAKKISQALDADKNEIEFRSLLALRWAYHQDFRRSVSFPLIHDHGRMERVSLRFSNAKQLTRQAWPVLGSIVDHITLDKPLYQSHPHSVASSGTDELDALMKLSADSPTDEVNDTKKSAVFDNRVYILYDSITQYSDTVQEHELERYIKIALERSSSTDPWRADLVSRLLVLLKKSGRHSEAVELVMKEDSNCNQFPDFYFAIGHLFLDWATKEAANAETMLPVAEAAWRKCLSLGERPDLVGAVHGRGSNLAAHNLALVLEGTGRIAEAASVRVQYSLPTERMLA
jgi:hypothetical protein